MAARGDNHTTIALDPSFGRSFTG